MTLFARHAGGVAPPVPRRAYVRYQLHVYAFLYLAANPFPGFAGAAGTLPARPRAARRRRGRTAGRPASASSSRIPALARQRRARLGPASSPAVLTWFVRARARLRAVGACATSRRTRSATTRRRTRTSCLLTDAYPHASPLEGAPTPQHEFDEAEARDARRRRSRRAPRGAGRGVVGWPRTSSGRRRCRRRCTCRTSTSTATSPSAQLHAAASFSTVSDLLFWAIDARADRRARGRSRAGAARWARESAAGPVGTGMLLGMLGFALVWAVAAAASASSSCGGSAATACRTSATRTYLFGNWFALGGQFVFLCLALAIVMGLARRLPADVVARGGARVRRARARSSRSCRPYLLGTHRLADPQLRAIASRLEAKEGVGHVPVVVENDPRRHVAAERGGDGARAEPARRALFDTLLDGRFTTGELTGRHGARARPSRPQPHLEGRRLVRALRVPRHVPARARGAAARRDGRAGGRPARAARARRPPAARAAAPERDQPPHGGGGRLDGAAHDARSARHGRRSSARFVPTTLDEPSPSTWDYVWEENHPTIVQRIAMAEAYATSAAQSP